MHHKSCDDCCNRDICQDNELCEDFIPSTEKIVDIEIDNLIEGNRIVFHNEWFNYIEKFYAR